MDLYTTSFILPQRPSLPSPASQLPDNTILTDLSVPTASTSTSNSLLSKEQIETDWEAVQKLATDITTREGCLVTVTRNSPSSDQQTTTDPTPADPSETSLSEPMGPIWNFHLSGSYQSVMAARGAILREHPRDNQFVLKVPRIDILESPMAEHSGLKVEVQRRLDDIAAEMKAGILVRNVKAGEGGKGETLGSAGIHIPGLEGAASAREDIPGQARKGHSKSTSKGSGSSIPSGDGSVNETSGDSSTLAEITTEAIGQKVEGGVGDVSDGVRSYGLETERMCEIVITGSLESVSLAKVRVLIFIDELSGLHAEPCDIDYKLHAILAGRKRTVIQSIQEETGVNIYLPIPLVGIHDRPLPGSHQAHTVSYRSLHPPAGTITSQNTGMTQMTGYSQAPPSSLGIQGWMMGPQMTGSMAQGQGGQPGYGQGRQGHVHGHPVYNPHQHVQYPYQPQTMQFDHSHQGRGMGYGGPAHHFGNHHQQSQNMQHQHQQHHAPQHQNHHQHHHQQQHQQQHMNGISSPMSMPLQHTGASTMTGYEPQSHRGMPNQRHTGGYNQGHHQHNHNQQPPHHFQQHHQNNHQHGNQQHNQHQHNYQNQQHHHPNFLHQNGQHSSNPPHMQGMSANPYMNGQHQGHNGMVGHRVAPASNMGSGGGIHMSMPGQYVSGPHPGLSIHGGEQGSMGKANQIWITGEFFGVQRARDMLLNVAMQKSKLVISRDTAILPRKLDWLLTERLEDIKSIMSDNGTYLQVPPLGSQASLITVFGDHRVNIERTIRGIMALACQFYVASVWLLPVSFEFQISPPALNPVQMQPVLKRIANASGAEVVFKGNCFEVHGLETEVRAAVSMILELDVIHNFHHEIRFQIELANEQREFISGKKNGKINKIMKLAGVQIKFETLNDYNFLMDVAGSNIQTLDGLTMLQEELPAEISLHVPENYHKRIIGVAGKNIQRIMKLYGVYVKFSNSEEYSSLGGYKENEDNVIARTPTKNFGNLDNLKQSIMELVNVKDRDYIKEYISIPRRYHRTLLGEKSIFIHDIEHKTNSIIRFPYKESASDMITIFGPESQVHIAAAMLLDHVPFEADLHVHLTPELTPIVTSPDFILFTERVKRDHQIAITPSTNFGQGGQAVFKFRCQRSHVQSIALARDALEECFEGQNVELYPAGAEKRADTFMDAFLVSNTRSLSARSKAVQQTEEPEEMIILPQSRSRSITTDVKAIFDGPPYAGVADDLAPTGNKGFAGPLSYHDPRRTSEYWQSPQPIRSEIVNTPPAIESSIHAKRESDPLIHDKVRQATIGPGVPLGPGSLHGHGHGHGHPRGTSARTQSLDITSLNFSRTLSQVGGGLGPMPSSPGGILGNGPNTASGPYFPPGSGGSGSGGKGYPYDQTGLEGVTTAIGNINV